MDFVLVCHNSHGIFHETLNESIFCLPLFHSTPKPLTKCVLVLTFSFNWSVCGFPEQIRLVALPFLLSPLTLSVIPCVESTQADLPNTLQSGLFSFSKHGPQKPHMEKAQKENIKKSVTCPKLTDILELAGVPRILCIMGNSSFCMLFSWSKLRTHYLPPVCRQSIPSAVLLLALGTVHDQPELDLFILSLGIWELSWENELWHN